MRSQILLLTISLLFSSCLNKPKPGQNLKNSDQNQGLLSPFKFQIQNINTPKQSIETDINNDTSLFIYIKDSSDYSSTFIKSLKPGKPYWQYFLDSNLLIINNHDTSYFPVVPPLGKELHFSNRKNIYKIDLYVKRILLSTIEYKIELTDIDKKTFKSGVADLSPHFFVGPEIDEDDSTNYGYYSIEYWDPSENYQTALRFGIHKKLDNLYLAKVICFLNNKWFNLYNFPTLFEKIKGSP